MSAYEVAAARRQAFNIVLSQLGITVLLAGMCAWVWDPNAGYSALAGGGIGAATTGYMAFALLKYGAGSDPRRVAWGFFLGWAVKILLTIGLLLMAFRSKSFAPVPLLMAYTATFCAYWIAAVRGGRIA